MNGNTNGNGYPHSHSQSPPLPSLQSLSISPYPHPTGSSPDYRYNGVFGPPNGQSNGVGGWSSPDKRGSRSGIPTNWYDPPSRESSNHFDPYGRQNSPPTLSPPSSTTSAPTSSSIPYQSYQPTYNLDHNYAPTMMAVTPSPPPAMNFGMNSTTSVPNISAFAGGMPQFGSQSLASLTSRVAGNGNGIWRSYGSIPDDDVIPTAIVIKNIPFAVGRETLLAVIESLGAPLPYAFNYHHDNGVFRGLAFANFRAPDEAAAVVAALNGYDVQGRKLRVEYKKVLQPGEKDKIEREKALKRMRSIQFDAKEMPPPLTMPPRSNGAEHSPPQSASSANSDTLPMSLDLNDPVALDIYGRILVFKEDRMRDEMAFSRNLTATERRIVHLVTQKLGLVSITKNDGDIKYVVVTREPARPTLTSSQSGTISSSYLSPYSTTPTDLSPQLRIKKSMPDLRGFNGPVVAREPSRSLTPQRSSGNLRDQRDYVSMGASSARRLNGINGGSGSGSFNHFFGAPLGDIPPVPPLPSGLHRSSASIHSTSPEDVGGGTVPTRHPRGPAGESRGFGVGNGTANGGVNGVGSGNVNGHGLRPSSSGILRGMGIGRRLDEADEEEGEGLRVGDGVEV